MTICYKVTKMEEDGKHYSLYNNYGTVEYVQAKPTYTPSDLAYWGYFLTAFGTLEAAMKLAIVDCQQPRTVWECAGNKEQPLPTYRASIFFSSLASVVENPAGYWPAFTKMFWRITPIRPVWESGWAYKVVKVKNGLLASTVAASETEVSYPIGAPVTARRAAYERGYYPTAFDTLEHAIDFVGSLDETRQVWKCSYHHKTELKPRLASPNMAASDAQVPSLLEWPEGTFMAEWIALKERVA